MPLAESVCVNDPQGLVLFDSMTLQSCLLQGTDGSELVVYPSRYLFKTLCGLVVGLCPHLVATTEAEEEKAASTGSSFF